MKIERYLKLREDFLSQYGQLSKNELGFVDLDKFKIYGLREFIFLFSCDFKDVVFNSIVNSLSAKQFYIKDRYVSKLKINSSKSFLDKYPEHFEQWVKYYNNKKL